jgi:hypothetical protein
MDQDQSKNRKSKELERFEEADNAGRFSGDDADASSAREAANERIRQDTGATASERNKPNDATDAEARRDRQQSHDYKGESQNVNDDNGRPLTEQETEKARNKANEGLRQAGSEGE